MGSNIKDVAKLAGVAPSTVSRVIHDNSRISQATKEKVRHAMDELGYVPNAAASSLAGRTPRTLGLVLPNNPGELFKNPFFINAMRGISVYAQERGYFLLYSFSRDEEDEVQFIRNYINSGWVSGVVLLAARKEDRCVEYLKSVDFPFVLIGHAEDPLSTCWVDNDNFQAMYQVVTYLIEKGHRKIGFLGGPETFRVTQDRYNGYIQALNGRGFPIDEKLIFMGDDFSEEAGEKGGGILLGESLPDAIVTTDDQLAFGLLKHMEGNGIKGVDVTGFNNTVRGIYQKPGLTSVDINADLLGERAAELLIKLLETEESERKDINPNHYLVETMLIRRDTA
ncbi:MAG: LacI family DNA-binding transcriptional regulator [Spirochaetales bacterium]|nr:LacI family DNA-binding transcriptional regulator [Spirochaetales bacterium]